GGGGAGGRGGGGAAGGPPQCLDVAPCGAADGWIEFPGPTAVRPLSHGVAEPLADVRERSSRIERVGVPNRLVEAREVVYPQLPPDGFTAGGSDRGHDVDADEAAHAGGACGWEGRGVQTPRAPAPQGRH